MDFPGDRLAVDNSQLFQFANTDIEKYVKNALQDVFKDALKMMFLRKLCLSINFAYQYQIRVRRVL